MSDIAISCRSLTKRFGSVNAVRGVTLQVPEASIFGFIGPSGSGKTTTVRLLTGASRPDSGEVHVLGHVPSKFDQATKARIGYMPQHFTFYPNLTVRENLNFAASIYGMGFERRQRLHEMLAFVELAEAARRPVKHLSGGMQRRVSLAATLMHDPDVLFLDEPTTGIDPVLRMKFWSHFKELQNRGKTFFVTTQYVSDAAHCDQVAMVVDGRVLVVDTPDGLRRQAFHGDILEIIGTRHWDAPTLTALKDHPAVQEIMQVDDHLVRFTVTEAARALPELISWFRKQQIAIETAEEHIPTFDDVFVELVKGRPNVA